MLNFCATNFDHFFTAFHRPLFSKTLDFYSASKSGIVEKKEENVRAVMCRDTCWGRSDQLTNYCYHVVTKRKGHRKYCGQPSCRLANFFDQLSCKFENIGGRDAPHAPTGTFLRALEQYFNCINRKRIGCNISFVTFILLRLGLSNKNRLFDIRLSVLVFGQRIF